VLGEDNQPVQDARVTTVFRVPKSHNPWDGVNDINVYGSTDRQGLCSSTNRGLDKVYIVADKQGYYQSITYFVFNRIEAGKQVPWNPTIDLRLRQKMTPVALYAQMLLAIPLPKTEEPVGYDLLAGDWVAPHGKGTNSDFVFTLHSECRGRYDFAGVLKFEVLGAGNGLEPIPPSAEVPESELRFPRTAPETGYSAKDSLLSVKMTPKTPYQETNSLGATNFFFRVRTEFDENNRVKQALYGKLIGPIQCNLGYPNCPTGAVSFTYYVNPEPNLRNLEFDPARNLFGRRAAHGNALKP
jgi:hypothetical protein